MDRVRKTRSADKVDPIVGREIDHSLAIGTRLPLNRAILRRYLHFRNSDAAISTKESSLEELRFS